MHNYNWTTVHYRAKYFTLSEIRRAIEILTTNLIKDEEEIKYLGGLMERAGIISNNRMYDRFLDKVFWNTSLIDH